MSANRVLVMLALFAGLAGCGPLVKIGDDAPPLSLHTLRVLEPLPAMALPTPLLVDEPEAVAELRSPRMAVRTSPTGIEYLARARWVDPPARLFSKLLEEQLRFAADGQVLSFRQIDAPFAYRLNSRLIDFHVDVSDKDNPRARVSLYLTLLTAPNPRVVSVTRVDVAAPLASTRPDAVAVTMNELANAAARQIADWLAAVPTASGRKPG